MATQTTVFKYLETVLTQLSSSFNQWCGAV